MKGATGMAVRFRGRSRLVKCATSRGESGCVNGLSLCDTRIRRESCANVQVANSRRRRNIQES